MTLLRLAYIDRYRDRHGKLRHYYRRKGMRFPLPGRPGEPEFMAAYEAAAAQFDNGTSPQVDRANAGTFDALATDYYQSPAFLSLRASTKTTYRGIIDRWRSDNGRKRVAHLKRQHVTKFIADKMQSSGPWAANNLLSLLKLLMRFAVENEWRADDPTQGVRSIRAKTQGFPTWSEEDIVMFEKRWPKGSRERLAMALLLYTGQRRGDVVRMGWQHVSGDTIRVTQSKTGVSLVIPLHAELSDVLAETPRANMTFQIGRAHV